MPRNIEIKARIDSLETIEPRVRALSDSGPTDILQDDTFFNCPHGRLKLRQFDETLGELIAYTRADTDGPKLSDYLITPTQEPTHLRDTLAAALGVSGRVRKQRRLYLKGRTRLHLDRVEGLGDFLELEVVLEDQEPLAAGEQEARDLLHQLGVNDSQRLAVAYVDLLAKNPGAPGTLP